jgi:hypothetical protein
MVVAVAAAGACLVSGLMLLSVLAEMAGLVVAEAAQLIAGLVVLAVLAQQSFGFISED